jgi:hypothetical protein
MVSTVLKQSESEADVRTLGTVGGLTPSLTDRSTTSQGGRGTFHFTPIPENACPATELAIWEYDAQRLWEAA